MQPLTRDKLVGNAYRTLGLSAASTQAQIEGAARKMRIWPDPARIPPTVWDLPLLGPLSRSRSDIEQAVARLNDPLARLEERLLWFHIWHAHGAIPAEGISIATDRAASDRSESADTDETAILHDAVVARLQSAFARTDDTDDPAPWRHSMDDLLRRTTDSQYAQWIGQMESAGDFEKRVSPQEIEDAILAMPAALAASIVSRMRAALDRGDTESVRGLFVVLSSSSAARKLAERPLGQLLDRLEDVVETDCQELDATLRSGLQTNRVNPQPFYVDNYQASKAAAEFYNSRLYPALDRFTMLADDDSDRLMRVRGRCGEVLQLVALGWEWSGRCVTAEETLLMALDLAQGSQFESGIREALHRVQPLAQTERGNAESHTSYVDFSYSAAQHGFATGNVLGGAPIGYATPSALPSKKKIKSMTAVGTWIFAAIFIVSLIGQTSTSTSSHSSSPSGKSRYRSNPYVANEAELKEELARVSKAAKAMSLQQSATSADLSVGSRPPGERIGSSSGTTTGRVHDSVGETNREP